MSIVNIRAVKDIPRDGLPPIKAGKEVFAAKDYADKWIEEGLAEIVTQDLKPIDIPKVLAKEKQVKKD